MKKSIAITVVILLVISGFSTGFKLLMDQDKQAPPSPRENFERYCAGCHGSQMERFAGKTYQSGVSNDHLKNVIKNGLPVLGMPAFDKTFSEEDIDKITNYILTEITNKPAKTAPKTFPAVIESQHLKYQIDTIVTGLDVPWCMTFLPNNDMLVTERSGQLFRFRDNKLAAIIKGVPTVFNQGQGGLFDVVLHPQYHKNGWLYISYAKKSTKSNEGNTAVFMAQLINDSLVNQQELFVAQPFSDRSYHFGGRMVFDNHNHLFIPVGDRGNQTDAQLLTNYCGKIHRINDDGTIPNNNPFLSVKDAVPSIYSYGHRNPQGMGMHPVTKQIWANEHGPKGGDEINIIRAGKNYGWPEITYGINYNGTPITPYKEKEGMEQPIHQWTPSIAPSSFMFVAGNKYPQWKGDILSGSLSFRYLERTRIIDNKTVETEKLLDGIGRVRHVTMGNDGYIYVAIEKPGTIVRLLPVKE